MKVRKKYVPRGGCEKIVVSASIAWYNTVVSCIVFAHEHVTCPSASSAIRKTWCRRRLGESAIRKTIRRVLLRPETPRARDGNRLDARCQWAALGWFTCP